MADGLTITQATEQDWERVRAIRLAALQGTPDAFASTFDHESAQPPEWWQGRLRAADAATLLATRGHEDAGMIVVVCGGTTDEAWLCGVWVSPTHRGHGVGDALMSAAVSRARSMGVKRLVLEVAQTNAHAATLYSRHGFVATGRISTLPPPRTHVIEVEYVLRLDGGGDD
jgi:ribosomal protein S18 acetylase RimI-like enzyme